MPSWNSAIESIFSAHLPAKFAYTGMIVDDVIMYIIRNDVNSILKKKKKICFQGD